MGNCESCNVDLSKYDLTDLDKNRHISMEEFENIYVIKTGERPSWTDWLKFMECDKTNDYHISVGEYIEYMCSSKQ